MSEGNGKMKKSRKMLLGTLLTAYAVIFVFVGVNRATENRDYLPADERVRTTQAELDSYTGYNRIVANGDYDLEVIRGDTWSVTYTPVDENRGALSATQTGQTLFLEGFGNRSDAGRGSVRVTLPALESLSADFHTLVTVDGFDQETLSITARNSRTLTLSGNVLDTLELDAIFLQEINYSGNTIDNEQLQISAGETFINRQ